MGKHWLYAGVLCLISVPASADDMAMGLRLDTMELELKTISSQMDMLKTQMKTLADEMQQIKNCGELARQEPWSMAQIKSDFKGASASDPVLAEIHKKDIQA